MLMRKNTYLIFLFIITFFNTLLVLAQDVLPTTEKIYTPNQIEMIKDQRDMVKKNRETFRNSLSNEQKSMLKNSKLSIKERQLALMKSLTENQKEVLKGNRESVRKIKESFSKSLTNKQKMVLKRRRDDLKGKREKLKDYKAGSNERRDKLKQKQENFKDRFKKQKNNLLPNPKLGS
jgi:hypothetical protein